MADYLTNTIELTAVADAIREKTGESGDLIYPNGFVNAIGEISGGSGDSQLYIFTQYTYGNTAVHVNNKAVYPDTAYKANADDAITFETYGDYILDTVTGVTSGNSISFTTVQRGTYTFTMPNESVYCSLLYDD